VARRYIESMRARHFGGPPIWRIMPAGARGGRATESGMARTIEADLCVIGAGSGGLTVAAGGSQMGARTVLIEAHRMGGDCLNTGCVPSKSLLAAAAAAQAVRSGGRFGVNGHAPAIDHAALHAHVQGVIAAIAPMDSVERFTGLGVTVIQARARFTDPRTVVAGDATICARRFVIATGSRAAVPPIPGLAEAPFLTNETIFAHAGPIDHLLVIGAGPIGTELAQAHRRLGAAVTILDRGPMLPNDDPEMTEVIRRRFAAEGIALLEGVEIDRVERHGNGIAVMLRREGAADRIEGSHLLVAAGRAPNIEDLGLDAAGIAHTPRGVTVDRRLRTSNRRVHAVGDVAGGLQFTHVANYHAGIVLRNVLFRLPAKVDTRAIPWVTYTDPELAHVGLTEAQARAAGEGFRILRFPFAENDRAQAERAIEGHIKVVVGRRGRVLGATIVGAHAGELLLPWVLAIAQGLKIGAMAAAVAPYPTLGEVSKRAAGSFYTPTLFSERTRRIVRFLARFG